MAKRIVTKIGDVFCVEVDNAYKRYFQYFCNDMTQLNSSVIRVFKKRYLMDYCPTMEEIVSDEVDFYAHTILRDGIEDGSWYKVGKANGNYLAYIDNPIFGVCEDSIYNNGNSIKVDPNSNWYLWKINQSQVAVGTLPEQYRNSIFPGSVFCSIEIMNRITFGYYRWTSPEYALLQRKPYPDTDSYIKNGRNNKTVYLHFKGEYVIQKIEIDENGLVNFEEGAPLPQPLFWETNWKYAEFITAEEFDEVWKKYANML